MSNYDLICNAETTIYAVETRIFILNWGMCSDKPEFNLTLITRLNGIVENYFLEK